MSSAVAALARLTGISRIPNPLHLLLDNPYMVAQKWLAKHELPDSYVDQIVDFIDKNTSGVSIGSTTAGTDPFTGAGSYRPGNSAPNTTGNVGVDPFTGAGSYRPNQPGSSHKSSGVDPWTGEPLMYPS